MPAERFRRLSRAKGLTALAIAAGLCGAGPPAVFAGDAGGDLDACGMLAASNLETLLGGPHDGGMLLFEQHDGALSFSQCRYAAAEGDRAVGLAIRRDPASAAPDSREAFIALTRSEDVLGTGADTAAALQAGRALPDLGDLALSYELFSFNLLIWEGNHQLTILLEGFAPDEAEAQAIAIATSLLDQL